MEGMNFQVWGGFVPCIPELWLIIGLGWSQYDCTPRGFAGSL
jgi:hypothetical protein